MKSDLAALGQIDNTSTPIALSIYRLIAFMLASDDGDTTT